MVNLITRMVSIETGDRVESNTFYGNFMVKLLWRLSGNLSNLVKEKYENTKKTTLF